MFRLAVLISGGGGLMMRLIAHGRESSAIQVCKVIASRSDCGGVTKARTAGIPTTVIERRLFSDIDRFSEAVWQAIEKDPEPDGVIMLGWLPFLRIPPKWYGRVVNAHPSLLPLFGGRGMWGARVHEAVLNSGMRVSGLTFHFVDNGYDSGPIIHQSVVPVLPNDTVETLQERVIRAQYHMIVPVVTAWSRGEIALQGGRVHGGPVPQWFCD